MRFFATQSRARRSGARRFITAAIGLIAGVFGAGSALAEIQASMSMTPPSSTYANPILPGDVTAIRISLTNDNSNNSVTAVSFTANLGAGLKAVRVVPGSYACKSGAGVSAPATGTVTATAGGTTVTLSGGEIPVAASGGSAGQCTVDIEVTSTSPNTVGTAQIAVGDLDGVDNGAPVTSNSLASQTITVQALMALTLSKQFSATTAPVGNPFTMTLVIGNPNTTRSVELNDGAAGDTTAYALLDNLPSDMVVAPIPNISKTCTNSGTVPPVVAAAAGASTVQIEGGVVAPGGTCTIKVDLVTTSSGATYSSDRTNSLAAGAVKNRRGLNSNAASDTISSTGQFQVTKAFALSPIAHGQESTLTITLKNASTTQSLTMAQPFQDSPLDGLPGAPAYGIRVTPAGATSTCGPVATINSGHGVELPAVTLAPLATCVITVPFVGTLQDPGVPQAFTNTIPAGAVVFTDPNVHSPLAAQSVTVVDQLTVSKSVFPTGNVAPGNPVRYTVTINNYAAGVLSNVVITDVLPAGMIYLPTPAPVLSAGSCTGLSANSSTPGTAVLTIASMPAGTGAAPSSCSVQFYAQTPTTPAPDDPAASKPSVSNHLPPGSVTGTGPGGPVTNAGDSGDATTTAANIATVAKTFSPAAAAEGVVSQLKMTFTNLSAKPLTNAHFLDTLPTASGGGGQLIVATPANASTTCGGTVTANPGDGSVELTGATVPARANNGAGAAGTCTLTVSVIGGAGTFVNILPVGALSGTEELAEGGTRTASSPGPVQASLVYSAALTAAKSFLPTTISSGGVSTVTIRLGNSASGTLNNVSFNDPLPAGMKVAPTPSAQTTCDGAQFNPPAAATSVSMTGAIIPAGIHCTVQFDVVATGAGAWTNTIPVGSVTADGGVRNTTPITATLANSTVGGVIVTNAMSVPSLTAPLETATLTITVTNSGSVPLTNLNLTDYFTVDGLPGGAQTGLVVADAPNTKTTCSGAPAPTATGHGTSVSLIGASLPAGASCTFSVDVTMTASGTVQNTIPVGAISNAEGISNTLNTQTSLSASANPSVSKKFTPTTVGPGQPSRLQITLGNPSSRPATALAVTDVLPAGLLIAASPNATTTCSGATISAPAGGNTVGINGGTLAAATVGGQTTCIVEVDVTAAVAGAYHNVIAVNGMTATINGAPVTNPVPADATLQVRSPVGVGKSFNPTTVDLGAPTVVTLTLTNPNATPLTEASLKDNLPAGLTVALTPNTSTTCGGVVKAEVSATFVTLTGATIPANGACAITFDAVSNVSGAYVNTIPAGNIQNTQGVTNELPATATVRVTNRPTVSKQFSPASIPAGTKSTLTIVLGNTNTTDATLSADMVDTLPTSPAAIVVATPNALVSTCTGTAATAVAGSGTVTLPTGAKIPAGGCSITVEVTGATEGTYVNTIPVAALKTDLGDNVQPTNANLVISPLGFISGRVFKDTNITPNGLFDGADTPIAGVAINLTGTDYGADGVSGGGDDSSVNRPTVTDALGNYAFTGLNPGAYTVTQPSQPANTVNGITTGGAVAGGGGGTPGVGSNPTTTPSTIGVITLLKDGSNRVASSPSNNFAEVQLSSIAGSVFLDQNDNGQRNSSDAALATVTVELLDGANAVVATATTDSNGAYRFTNLQPGTYSVREPTQPTGTANGKTIPGTVGNGGTAGTASAQNVIPSTITGIILPPATDSTGNDFAEVSAGRQIGGRVFAETDNNGLFNPATERPLPNVRLDLTGTDFNGQPVNRTTTTDASGLYSFLGLAEGTYVVTEPIQPPGTVSGVTTPGTGGVATPPTVTPSVISIINLTGGATVSLNNNFAEIEAAPATGVIKGKVYVDRDDDGVADAGEPGIPNITVSVMGTAANGNPVSLQTTTDANGDYVFDNVPPSGAGGYKIIEMQPRAYADGKTTAGSSGTAATTKPVAGDDRDIIDGVTLSAGDVSSGHNYGERPTGASIRGSVYFDANGDGAYASAEQGIKDVTVRLSGTDINGVAVSLTTTTDASGAYVFNGLTASNAAGYTITEVQPDATYTDGTNSIASGNPGKTTSVKPVAAAGSDIIDGVVLTATGALNSYDFGERKPGGSVSGYVFIDTDNDGDRDPGEGPLASVPVRLTGTDINGKPVSLTTTTGADGAFTFTNVPPSNPAGYTITEEQPSGVTDGKTRVQTGNPGAPVTGKPVGVGDMDQITGVVVQPTSILTDYRFGEIAIPQLKPPIINGYVFLDRDHDRVRPRDGSTDGQAGWTVVLRQNGTVICTVTTDDKGFYQFDNLHCPGYEVSGLPLGSGYSITFTKDGGSLPAVPISGDNRGQVPPTGGQITNITLTAADRVLEQNLPLDPAGVVYDSTTRQPVPGATVVITGPGGFDPSTMLVGGTAAQTQVTGGDGYYGFLLQNGFPSGVYTLTVTSPAGYLPTPSSQLPPCVNTLNVTRIPDPALIQASDAAPGQGVTVHNPAACQGQVPGGSATTQYFFNFGITNGGSAPILNNHIPLDRIISGAILVTKTTPKLWVSRGDLVPYTITATNPTASPMSNISIRDQLPPGFKYREGSATRDRLPVVPKVDGGFVTWPTENFAGNQKKTYTLMLTVGAGVGDGDYTNRAWAGLAPGGTQISNLATAQVRIAPDPTLDCPDVIGKVFDDRNANGYQDDGEPGIPSVRMATPNGLLVTSDAEGRFHVPCPATPNADRGSNFVMKLDERSLPSGYRVTTENPRDVRLTRGKLSKLNFGATVHRVVRVELTSEAFEPGKTDLKADWRAKIEAIQEPLRERPSIVRIAYGPGGDPPDLVKRRTREVRDLIERGWKSHKRQYALVIEIEGEQ